MGDFGNDASGHRIFELRHQRLDNSVLLLFQLLFPICGSLIGFTLALAVRFSLPTFPREGLLLFDGEEFEVLIIKSVGVMVFDLFSIHESNGPRLKTLVLVISAFVISAPVILMFIIMVFLGSCLLNSPHVLAFIIGIRVPTENVRFDISHGLHVGEVWPILHFINNDWMNMV